MVNDNIPDGLPRFPLDQTFDLIDSESSSTLSPSRLQTRDDDDSDSCSPKQQDPLLLSAPAAMQPKKRKLKSKLKPTYIKIIFINPFQ